MNVVNNGNKLPTIEKVDKDKKNNDDYIIDKNKLSNNQNSVKSNSINSIVASTLNVTNKTSSTNTSTNVNNVPATKRISTKQVYNVKDVLNSKK